MRNWADEKSLDGTITNSSIKFGGFNLELFRRITYPKTIWNGHCYIGSYPAFHFSLKSEKLSEAKCQAKAKMQVILETALTDLTGGCDGN